MPKKSSKVRAKSFKRVCFCCDKKIGKTVAIDDGFDHPPNDATVWRSHGNYGSTVFDPMDSTYLEAYICDACLLKGKKKLYRARTVMTRSTVVMKLKDIFA